MINPWSNPEAYFKFIIGTTESPGVVVSAEGWDSEWNWDEKAGKGARKANITHTGQKLAEGSFTVELWAPHHADAWESFYALCAYNTDKKPAGALNLYYPTVSAAGVLAVVTRKITPMVHVGKGKYRSTFSFKEWVPAPKKNATYTPKGATDGPKTKPYSYIDGAGVEHIDGQDPGEQPVPIDQAQLDQIAALQREAFGNP